MAYGSGATWSGTDTSEQSASVDFTATTSSSERESGELTGHSFTIPPRSTPNVAAANMAAALNLTANGARVQWPEGTEITNMSFTVDGGPPREVPGMGAPVPVFGGLSVRNT